MYRLLAFGAVILFISAPSLAQELPSIVPANHDTLFRDFASDFCGLALIGGPMVGAVNARPLFRSAFREGYQPTGLTKNWIYASQTTIFAGFGACIAGDMRLGVGGQALAIILGGTAGYWAAKSAFDGNKAAASTAIVIPLLPLIPFVMLVTGFAP